MCNGFVCKMVKYNGLDDMDISTHCLPIKRAF